jgi:aminopeptidase 2
MDVDTETEIQGGAKKAVKFTTSPLMSTYLELGLESRLVETREGPTGIRGLHLR